MDDLTIDNTGTAEPATPVTEAPKASPSGDSGQTIEERNAGFLKTVSGETADDVNAKKTEPTPSEKAQDIVEDPAKSETVKDEKATDATDAEEDEDDELELLTDEQIDEHKNAPKSLRKYAKSVTKKYGPVVEVINGLGGVEAVKRLDHIQTLVTSSPTRPDAPEVVEYLGNLRKTNPQFANQLNTNVFYGALDENPALLDSIIKSELGEDWTRERLQKVAQLVEDGEIDIEAIEDIAKDRLDPAERTRREAEQAAQKSKDDARDAKLAELEKGQAEGEAKAKKAAVESDITSLTKVFNDAREPVWKQFKLLPVDGEPEDIAADKDYLRKMIVTLASLELSGSPAMTALNSKIENQHKGDDFEWLQLKAADALKSKTREIALRVSKFFSAYLKTYNQPASDAQNRRPEPLKDATTASQRTPTPTDEAQAARLTPEERRAGFQRILEKGSVAQ